MEPAVIIISRSLVRPLVTVGLVGATIVAAFVNLEAAKFLMAPTGIAIGFYFQSRDEARRNGA